VLNVCGAGSGVAMNSISISGAVILGILVDISAFRKLSSLPLSRSEVLKS